MYAHEITLLLVEDDPDDLALFERALRRSALELELHTAVDLATATGRLTSTDTSVDVVLCDLNLPDSQGLDTVETLLRIAPDVPVVVLTGVDDEALGLDALRAGAHDYLFKDELEPRRLSRSLLYAIERAHHELTRKAHADALRIIERNRFVEQLAVELIGELSNILTRQMVLVELVDEVTDIDRARPHLQDIAETTRQASALVADMRSFVPSGVARSVIALDQFVAQVEPELRAELPDGIELTVATTARDRQASAALASEPILRNLVTRLVSDIARREPHKGAIEIAVEPVDTVGADTARWVTLVVRHRRQRTDGISAPFERLSLDEVIERAPRVIPRGARLRLRASQVELGHIGGTLEISADGRELTLHARLPAASTS